MTNGLLKQGALCALGFGSVALPSAVTIHRSRESLWLTKETDRALKKKIQEHHDIVRTLDNEVNKYSTLYRQEAERTHSERWHKENLKKYSEQLRQKIDSEKRAYQSHLTWIETQNKVLEKDNHSLRVALVKAWNHPNYKGEQQ